jgi:hypothetical protein
VSLPIVISWATESSLRSWLLLPAGRARSESTCFRRISARTPPPIPPAAPSNPIGSPTRQKKARLLPRPRLDQGRRLPADGPSCLRARAAGLQLPAGRRLSLSLSLPVPLACRAWAGEMRFFGEDGEKGRRGCCSWMACRCVFIRCAEDQVGLVNCEL